MQFARETSKMWSGSCSAEPTARSLLAGPAEDLTPWWELDSRLAEYQRARPRPSTAAVARLPDIELAKACRVSQA